jgi:hypothetical protein
MFQNLNSVPPFDGTNYGYWKARMRFFLKSIDVRKIVKTGYLELVSRPPTTDHQCLVQMASFFRQSGAPDLDQTVPECLENLEERPRQQYLHRGKILRQSETAKTQLFFWQCFRSGPFAII